MHYRHDNTSHDNTSHDNTGLDMAERNCHLGQGVKTAPHRGQQLAVLGPGVVVVQVPAAEPILMMMVL